MSRDNLSAIDILNAYCYAYSKHNGQVDKAGQPYILHPVRVASLVDSVEAKITALLHDTVEDTDATIEDIELHFGKEVASHVKLLTRDKSEDYFDYVKRVKNDEVAREVKLADLTHNMDISRIPDPGDKDFQRLKKYEKAKEILQSISI